MQDFPHYIWRIKRKWKIEKIEGGRVKRSLNLLQNGNDPRGRHPNVLRFASNVVRKLWKHLFKNTCRSSCTKLRSDLPRKPTYGNKKAKKSGHCETKEKKRNRRKTQKMETINNTKKKMHATLKLNKFHSLTFAGQTSYTIPEITWLYPQEKFLLRSTSRYTYVLCIVYKCWCSCERGIFVWRESHPRKKKKRKIRLSLQLHIYTRRLPYPDDASTRDTGQAQNLRI